MPSMPIHFDPEPDSAQPHQRRCDRESRRLGQFAQKLAGAGAGIDHPAAGIEDRPLGGFHQLDQPGDGRQVAFLHRLVAGRLDLFRPDIFAGGELHVLRDVDQHRPRTTRGGDVEGLVDRRRQLVRLFHQPVMLGAGAGDADGIGLLEAVGADQEGRNLPGQHDDGDRIHQRIGQPGDGIGRARSRGDQDDPRLAGRAGIALGHVDGALFVAHQDVPDVVLLENLVINGKYRPARIAEYRIDA